MNNQYPTLSNHYSLQFNNGSVTISPFNQSKTKFTVIYIHGLGDVLAKILPLFFTYPFDQFNDIKIVAPQAPVRYVTVDKQTKTSWFDVKTREENSLFQDIEKSFSREDIEETYEKIKEIIEKEAEYYGNDYSKIILMGFSQGSALSLYTSLKLKYNFGHVVCLCGYKFNHVEVPESINFPLTIIHGTEDEMRPWEQVQKTYSDMKFNYSMRVIQGMRHVYVHEEIQETLSKIFKSIN